MPFRAKAEQDPSFNCFLAYRLVGKRKAQWLGSLRYKRPARF
ncbi:MAG: hypothetical protein WBB28_20905 [Crinalium sp.]